jgi:hypothetical protein
MTAGVARVSLGRVTSRQVACVLAGLGALLTIAAAVLTAVTGNIGISTDGGTIALSVTFLATGFLVARRQPGNPVGWLLLCTGLSAAFTTAAGLYARYAYGTPPHAMPLGRAIVFAENATWPVSILAGMAAVLLFPDGRLTRRWRRVLWVYVAVSLLVLISQAIPGAALASAPDLRTALTSPTFGQTVSPAVRFLASGLPALAAVPFWLAFVVRQVGSFRRARGGVRQQYKWFTAGAVVSLLGIVVLTVAESGGTESGIRGLLNVAATYATAIAFPLTMGVAIMRYRLYDIDRIVSRTLAYAIVTGLLAGLYAGLVLLATDVLAFKSPVAIAIATLVAVALFNPLRRRVQRVVDRRFNRAHYDAERTVAAFAARLQDGTDSDGSRADLLDVVYRALEPAHTSIWLKTADPR